MAVATANPVNRPNQLDHIKAVVAQYISSSGMMIPPTLYARTISLVAKSIVSQTTHANINGLIFSAPNTIPRIAKLTKIEGSNFLPALLLIASFKECS
jgi:uncharacterized membrane protein YqgA involved in biofilm formation